MRSLCGGEGWLGDEQGYDERRSCYGHCLKSHTLSMSGSCLRAFTNFVLTLKLVRFGQLPTLSRSRLGGQLRVGVGGVFYARFRLESLATG